AVPPVAPLLARLAGAAPILEGRARIAEALADRRAFHRASAAVDEQDPVAEGLARGRVARQLAARLDARAKPDRKKQTREPGEQQQRREESERAVGDRLVG